MNKIFPKIFKSLIFASSVAASLNSYALRIDDREYRFCVMDDGNIRDAFLDQNMTNISKLYFNTNPRWATQNGAKVLSGNNYGDSNYYAHAVFTLPNNYGTTTYDNWSLSHNYVVTWRSGSEQPIANKVWVKVDAPTGVKLKNIPETTNVDSKITLDYELLGSFTPFSGNGYFDVVYKSSDSEVAQINSNKIIVKKPGVVTITATVRARNRIYSDASYLIGTDKVEMRVIDFPEPTHISLSESQMVINIGETKNNSFTLTPTNAKNDVEWISNDPNILTIIETDDTSTVTFKGVARGETYVEAITSNGLSAKCYVTVLGDEDYKHVQIDDLYYDLNRSNLTATVVSKIDFNHNESYYYNDEYYNYIQGDVVIPSSIKFFDREFKVNKIGSNAFFKCDIRSIKLPNTLTSIEGNAFYQTSLTNIEIPESVASIGKGCFMNCSLENISLPKNLKKIPEECFTGTTSLRDIELPSTIEEIGHLAFEQSGLESIFIPSSTKLIGSGAFHSCKNLVAFYVDSDNKYFKIYNNCLYSHDLKIFKCAPASLDEIVFANETKEIDKMASGSNNNLKKLILPKNLTVIGIGAFDDCKNLKEISFNESLKVIEGSAFADCKSLTNLNLPESLNEIEEYAFYWCHNIKSISFGSKLKVIGEGAFDGVNPDNIYIKAVMPPTIENNTFSDYNATLFVPKGRIQPYSKATGWSKFKVITDEEDTGDVDAIAADMEDSSVEVYDMTGVLISDSIDTLAPGIYIVRQGKTVKKISVK